MPKSPPAKDFYIHVDPSCLTDSTDLRKPAKRNDSDQTVIHSVIDDTPEDVEGSQINHYTESEQGSEVSHNAHNEALIHAAARAVVASIEQDAYEHENSVLSARTEDWTDDGTEMTYEPGTELTHDGTDNEYDSGMDGSHEDAYDGSSSSRHEDDVFSDRGHSHRSSLNSSDEHHTDFDIEKETREDSGFEQDIEDDHQPISRMPSGSSNTYSILPEQPTVISPHPHTPAKVLSRPPFRTPSSVRALQMSSPTPSVVNGSPRSSKRPPVSRLGTPHSQSPTKMKTPGRFKVKKEYPLVLLHVTVLSLHWQHANAFEVSGDLMSRELLAIQESWKLLQEKLGDTVLDRGILLPHPQDSYEVLEERLLEALELPVRPRAKILTCGHYLGPDEEDGMSSEEESDMDDNWNTAKKEKWCDICNREVKSEPCGLGAKQKRFKVKVYASNGLMGAGAWAAAWREMERVDIEIEPLILPHMVREIMALNTSHLEPPSPEEFHAEIEPEQSQPQPEDLERAAAERRQRDEERMREIYGHPPPAMPEPHRHQTKHGDSFPELLFAAFKVAMRDRKNVLICILSFFVLFLALRPSETTLGHAENPFFKTFDKFDTAQSLGGESFQPKNDDLGTGLEELTHSPVKVPAVVKANTNDEKIVATPDEVQFVRLEQQFSTEAELPQHLEEIKAVPIVSESALPSESSDPPGSKSHISSSEDEISTAELDDVVVV